MSTLQGDPDPKPTPGQPSVPRSTDVWSWCREWKHALTPATYLVLDELAWRVNVPKHGNTDVWPGLDTIAANTGLERSTVTRALNHLEALHVITRHRSRGGRPTRRDDGAYISYGTRYTLHLDQRPHADSCPQLVRDAPVSDTEPARETVASTTAKLVRDAPLSSNRSSNQPPAKVSTSSKPTPTRATGGTDSSELEPIPKRLHPVRDAVARREVERIKATKYEITTPAGFLRKKRDEVHAVMLELMRSDTRWPDWLTYGSTQALTDAVWSKYRCEQLSSVVADQLDRDVDRATAEALAEAG